MGNTREMVLKSVRCVVHQQARVRVQVMGHRFRCLELHAGKQIGRPASINWHRTETAQPVRLIGAQSIWLTG